MSFRIGGRRLETYVLIVAPHRREPLLSAARKRSRDISEAVPTFSVGRNPLIVFASFRDGTITHVAEGRRGADAATDSVRLRLRQLNELTRPFSFPELTNAVPTRVQHHLRRQLQGQVGVLSPKSGDALVDYMAEADERVRDHLLVLDMEASEVQGFPSRVRANLGLQKDALNIALRIGGIELDRLVKWHPASVVQGARFFLEGVPGGRALEEDVLLADFSSLLGFELLLKSHPAVAHFRSEGDPSNQMTVIMANNRPLEQQTGVDLIYFNERYRSFVMVQYKAMEAGDGGSTFRWKAGDRFTRQVERMETLWEHIQDKGTAADPDAFRFSTNPFFLKFFTRKPFRVDERTMFSGTVFAARPMEAPAAVRKTARPEGRERVNARKR